MPHPLSAVHERVQVTSSHPRALRIRAFHCQPAKGLSSAVAERGIVSARLTVQWDFLTAARADDVLTPLHAAECGAQAPRGHTRHDVQAARTTILPRANLELYRPSRPPQRAAEAEQLLQQQQLQMRQSEEPHRPWTAWHRLPAREDARACGFRVASAERTLPDVYCASLR